MPDVKYTDEFPFVYQSLSQSTNPGWIDISDEYPIAVGNPAADQVEVRIQGSNPSGIYIVGLSATVQITAVNNSIQARFSLDGGSFWENFSRESKDTTDRQSMDYTFPKIHSGGAYDFVFQMKKENQNNIMQTFFANIWFDRKK